MLSRRPPLPVYLSAKIAYEYYIKIEPKQKAEMDKKKVAKNKARSKAKKNKKAKIAAANA